MDLVAGEAANWAIVVPKYVANMLLFVQVGSLDAIADREESFVTSEFCGGNPGMVETAEVPEAAPPEFTVMPLVAGSKF